MNSALLNRVLLASLIAWSASAGRAQEAPFQKADEAVSRFMKEHQVYAATLAVSRDGQLLHERAFGFADRARTTPLSPKVRMRIASVSKPITAAAIYHLVRDNRLQPNDAVMKFLPAPRYPAPSDKRWNSITVEQVLEHRGGWDRARAGDPMFRQRLIMSQLHTNSLTPKDVVRWMLGQPLQFPPGSKSVYSNFGYCLLGVIIEEAAGGCYADYVKRTIGHEAGMNSLTLSSTQPEQRNRDETWYDFGSEGERFLIEPMEAHGGWVCTAADLTRFMDKFWLDGQPRVGGRASWDFFGSLPGTTAVAVQRPDGLNFALLLNQREPGDKWAGQLQRAIDAAIP